MRRTQQKKRALPDDALLLRRAAGIPDDVELLKRQRAPSASPARHCSVCGDYIGGKSGSRGRVGCRALSICNQQRLRLGMRLYCVDCDPLNGKEGEK